MKLFLAPMEGVIDHPMRQLLTDIGGYDRCVTEFVRVTTNPVPGKVFRRFCPELSTGGLTRAGVPVYVQLLGCAPQLMARSAQTAVRAGAPGIDINFGCPAKAVNRHEGGSILLLEPSRVATIVGAVRQAVDPRIPVCAKIRLGVDNADLLAEIVAGIAAAGASELCIHARTRSDGYQPPAHWHKIANLTRPDNMNLIVNGEVWTSTDAVDAKAQSGCHDLMIGRGGLACPDLARIIKSDLNGRADQYQPMQWPEVAAHVRILFASGDSQRAKYVGNRTKQWLAYLRRRYAGASVLFQQIKRLTDSTQIACAIDQHCSGHAGSDQPVALATRPARRLITSST